jgi:peptidyl-prolyl cis-trans isomerase D
MDQTNNAQTDIPQSQQFLSTLFSTLKGEQSNLIETEEGGYFLLRPDEILETRKLSFLEAKAQVKAQWDTAQQQQLIMDKAKTLADASKGGIGLKDAAAKAGYKVNTTELFTRSADGLNMTGYPADLASIAFELSTGNVGLVEGSTKVAIIELNEIQKVIADKKSEEWKMIKQEIQASMQEDYIDTTLQLLRTQHNITINRPFINQLTVAQE